MVVQPPVMMLTPAPPMQSYDWSVAADALFLERSSGGSVPLGYTYYNPGSPWPPASRTYAIYSDDVLFPLEAGIRLEISHKLSNDITFSATFWGLQQWSVGETIDADPVHRTVLATSPYLQLPVFDNSLGYTASSQIDNVEFNAQFRLNGDDSYWKLDWLLGVRYVYFADQFALTGINDFPGATETLDFHTANNLVGPQTGLLFVRGWDRVQWDVGLKFGLMANIYHQHGTDTASDPSGIPAGFTPGDISHTGGDVAALFEVTLGARFRLTDNLWFRVGYQFCDLTSLALAPRQLNGLGHGGNVAFDGLTVGLQATW